jgi:starch phosphorylase
MSSDGTASPPPRSSHAAGTAGQLPLLDRHLVTGAVVDPAAAARRELYEAAARSVRDILAPRWLPTEPTKSQANPNRVNYKTLEFQIRR